MGANLDILIAQRTGEHSPVFDSEKVVGQEFAEAAVDFADGLGCKRAALEGASVDPLLDSDVRFGLKLEVALLCVPAVVIF